MTLNSFNSLKNKERSQSLGRVGPKVGGSMRKGDPPQIKENI